MTLAELEIGKVAKIEAVNCSSEPLRRHILDMGLTPGTEVTVMKMAPMGDQIQILIRGYELTLRKADAAYITIQDIHEASKTVKKSKVRIESMSHPKVGEMGRYPVRQKGDVVPEGEILTFALAGNQNCGKTTLFNQLTGSNQHVGNFPGVTVDRKDGMIRCSIRF